LPKPYYAQALLLYAVIGLTPVLTFLVDGSNPQVTDAAGVVWHTRSIAGAGATVSIYTMLLAVALSAAKLFQAAADSPVASVEEDMNLSSDRLRGSRESPQRTAAS